MCIKLLLKYDRKLNFIFISRIGDYNFYPHNFDPILTTYQDFLSEFVVERDGAGGGRIRYM